MCTHTGHFCVYVPSSIRSFSSHSVSLMFIVDHAIYRELLLFGVSLIDYWMFTCPFAIGWHKVRINISYYFVRTEYVCVCVSGHTVCSIRLNHWIFNRFRGFFFFCFIFQSLLFLIFALIFFSFLFIGFGYFHFVLNIDANHVFIKRFKICSESVLLHWSIGRNIIDTCWLI